MDLIFNKNFIKKKIYSFDSPQRISLRDEFFKPSAVLFAIIPYKDNPYELVLIHRTERGSKHRGEMSFPGGKFDPNHDNSLKDTALRETEEEIGVPKDRIEILGCLHDFPTMTKYIISPFIGLIDKDQKLVKDDREVQEIIKVPIDFFVSKKNFKEQTFALEGKKWPVYYFNYKNKINHKTYTIWGATAYMIVSYIKLIYNLNLSKLGIRRFNVDEIKTLKNYIKYKTRITDNLT